MAHTRAGITIRLERNEQDDEQASVQNWIFPSFFAPRLRRPGDCDSDRGGDRDQTASQAALLLA